MSLRRPTFSAATARWTDLGWPFLLLLLFIAVFRYQPTETVGAQSALDCASVTDLQLAEIEECLTLDSMNVELLVSAGDRYTASENPSRAEELYDRALAIDPFDGAVHMRLGELLLAKGDRPAAAREAAAALASQPGSLAAGSLAVRAATPAPGSQARPHHMSNGKRR